MPKDPFELFSDPVVLKLVCASEAPGNLIKTQIDPLKFLIQWVWNGS